MSRLMRVGVLLAGLVAIPGIARAANGLALDRYEPSASGSDWLRLDSLEFGDHRFIAAGLGLDFAHNPLTVRNGVDGTTKNVVVSNQAVLHAGASVVLLERLRFGLSIPAALYQSGGPGLLPSGTLTAPSTFSLGDVRIDADGLVFGNTGDRARLALGLAVHLPTGKAANYTSDGTLRVDPRIMAAGDVSMFTWAGQLWLEANRNEAGLRNPVTTRGGIGASAGARMLDRKLLVGIELFGTSVLFQGNQFASGVASPFEALAEAHYQLPKGWQVALGVGTALTGGVGAPTPRVIASVQWAPHGAPPPPPIVEPPPPIVEPPPPPAVEPPPVVDPPPAVEPPPPPPAVEPPPPPAIEPPPPPPIEPPPPVVEPPAKPPPPPPPPQMEIDVSTYSVSFENGSAELTTENRTTLTTILDILKENPQIERFEISGFTSSTGPADLNRRLSRQRAKVVLQWLIAHGIRPNRLVFVGYASSRPIASDETEEGQRANRRVEFKIERMRQVR